MKNSSPQSRITASPLLNTTILFLFAAPIVVIVYGVFVFNPHNIDNLLMYGLQVFADVISITVLLSLWLTILLDILIPEHHRVVNANERYLFEKNPKVDILVTVAGEPIEIISKTLRAVMAMEYPHKTYVLDDGASSEVEALAEELGVLYRSRSDRSFAKSGNLNFGLSQSKADFFAIFDADQVPAKDFLTKLLPYMADSSVGMVQSPQYFVNTHNFIAAGTAQAQAIFYEHVFPAKNISNSAFCVGTNVIFRRKAVNDIGGIVLVNHSEDIWTSYLLHESGWKTLFVNEVLAKGRAPETISSYFKQQLRWAQGGLSMMLLQNPLSSKKLSLDQRIQYFSSNFYYLVGFSILIYILSPIIYLLTGVKALNTDSGVTWLLHYLPYVGLYYSLTFLLLGKLYVSTLSTALASFYPYILAFFSIIFGTKHQWVATTSKRSNTDTIMKWIWPHVFIILLTIGALIVGWYNPGNFWTTFYNSLWAALNMYLLLIFITAESRHVVGMKVEEHE